MSLRLPRSNVTVWAYLKRTGPSTISCLAASTGLPAERLRMHLRAHRDAYDNEIHDHGDGVKLRLWFVKGPIG